MNVKHFVVIAILAALPCTVLANPIGLNRKFMARVDSDPKCSTGIVLTDLSNSRLDRFCADNQEAIESLRAHLGDAVEVQAKVWDRKDFGHTPVDVPYEGYLKVLKLGKWKWHDPNAVGASSVIDAVAATASNTSQQAQLAAQQAAPQGSQPPPVVQPQQKTQSPVQQSTSQQQPQPQSQPSVYSVGNISLRSYDTGQDCVLSGAEQGVAPGHATTFMEVATFTASANGRYVLIIQANFADGVNMSSNISTVLGSTTGSVQRTLACGYPNPVGVNITATFWKNW